MRRQDRTGGPFTSSQRERARVRLRGGHDGRKTQKKESAAIAAAQIDHVRENVNCNKDLKVLSAPNE